MSLNCWGGGSVYCAAETALKSSHSGANQIRIVYACKSPSEKAIKGKVRGKLTKRRMTGRAFPWFFLRNSGAPSRARTCDLLIRSQTLYPTELWVQSSHMVCLDVCFVAQTPACGQACSTCYFAAGDTCGAVPCCNSAWMNFTKPSISSGLSSFLNAGIPSPPFSIFLARRSSG